MPASPQLPTPFESIAALSKLVEMAEVAPAFYALYRQPIDMANGFIDFLGSHHRDLALIFTFTGAPVSDTATALEQFLQSTQLPKLNFGWVDQQMTVVMQHLIPMFRDPALPVFLQPCRWPIEGAFE